MTHLIMLVKPCAQYLKNEGRPNDQYILHATAVRSAQALGLHRHAPAHWGLSQQDQELRKRVWWAVRARSPHRTTDQPQECAG